MNERRWIRRAAAVGALVVAGMLGGLASQAFAGGQTFVDVGPSHPFYDDIEFMASSGIAGGYADDTYRPGQPVTRQAMAAFIHRAVTYDYVRNQSTVTNNANSVTAVCPAGSVVIGGGGGTSISDILLTDSRPTDTQNGWFVRSETDDDASFQHTTYAYAICASGDVGDSNF